MMTIQLEEINVYEWDKSTTVIKFCDIKNKTKTNYGSSGKGTISKDPDQIKISIERLSYFNECLALWVKFSADDILKSFFLFFQGNRIWHFMQIVYIGTILGFQEKIRKNNIHLRSASLAK